MLPSNYKRNYRFKTDTSKESKYFNLVIWAVIILAILWYGYTNFFAS